MATLAAHAVERLRTRSISLDEVPGQLQGLFEETTNPSEEVKREVRQRVIAEVFHEFYRDSDPLVQQILQREALRLPSRTAREMKRLLNLFRFYAFIAARRRVLVAETQESQRSTLESVARLAAFTIRWPYLLDLLSLPDPAKEEVDETADRARTLLEALEQARQPSEWEHVLLEAGLATKRDEGTVSVPEWSEALNSFLGEEPRIGAFARSFL